MLDPLELTGRARTHIVQLERPRCALHRDVVAPFLEMCAAAAADGIELAVFSAYRDFEAQLAIWNRKFRGERALYDREGRMLDHASLDEEALIRAILRWSALPGASRHHWGTDIDVFDAGAVPPEYRVQLLPDEYGPGGPFARLDRWLDENAVRFGFYRPYDRDRGGVNPEPWHISHAPIAWPASQRLTPALVAQALSRAEVLGREAVLGRLQAIFEGYVSNVAHPGASLGPIDSE
jgi:LAS superfamily LD-carboxypeptidase LdcB